MSQNKTVVTELFKLMGSGRFNEGLRFFAPDCVQHNPYIGGNMDALTDSMAVAMKEMGPKYPDAEFRVEHVLTDGDIVAVHTNLLNSRSKPSRGRPQTGPPVQVQRGQDSRVLGRDAAGDP